MNNIDDKIYKNIYTTKKEIEELLFLIDNSEVKIIEKNNKNTVMIDLYKIMMENLILEHHNTCKKIFN